MLRRLLDDVVVDAGYRIEPEVRLQQLRAGERREQARGDLLLRDAELERLGAIDLDLKARVVQRLGDAQVTTPGICAHPLLQAQRDIVVGLQVVAVYLRVDGGGQAEVEHLADDVGGLKICGHVWKARCERLRIFF